MKLESEKNMNILAKKLNKNRLKTKHIEDEKV